MGKPNSLEQMIQYEINGVLVLWRHIGEDLLKLTVQLIFVDATEFVERFNKSSIEDVGEQYFGQFA